jgi:hypothetical protein
MLEVLDARPAVSVQEAEYRRLLGYPQHHVPGERADELAEWARRWYGEHGRPWIYLREVELQVGDDTLRIDGMPFDSKQLQRHLLQAGAGRAMLVAVSAGRSCEEHARQLWQESKPDEYFFLEMFGSAVVEHLVATLSGRICDLAERDGLMAVPHYSPGYTGWDVADQNKLFELITRSMSQPFPEPTEAMTSGMLRPKKSLLAVVGLTVRTGRVLASPNLVPCEACSFSPCQYRRAPYRHAAKPAENVAAAAPDAAVALPPPSAVGYSVSVRALRKWAQERVRIEPLDNGRLTVNFRFDGTTCSNQGRPLAFDYSVTLSGSAEGYTIVNADCRPAQGDEGYTSMCSYLSDSEGLMQSIAGEKPLLGRPLNDVLSWTRESAPSGCLCSASQRAHKWGLALEAIHFALAQSVVRPVSPLLVNPP